MFEQPGKLPIGTCRTDNGSTRIILTSLAMLSNTWAGELLGVPSEAHPDRVRIIREINNALSP